MRDRVERLYDEGQLSDGGVQAAVGYGWLTQGEADDIIGQAA